MKFWNLIRNEQNPDADAILEIGGEIVAEKGWFDGDGVCVAKDFRAALEKCGNVRVKINSPGGDVMAGAEIYSALKEHSMAGRGKVTIIVTALAASAASIIAMAGDEILMYATSYMMIHNPWTMAVGDAKEMRKAAKTLDQISEGLISAYESRTGKSRDELKRMLEAETWMNARKCLEDGFCDKILGYDSGAGGQDGAVAMSAKAHGAMEILNRVRMMNEDEDEDEKDPDEEEKTEDGARTAREGATKADTGEDPDEDNPEEEDPEEEERKNLAARAEIALRAQIAMDAMTAAER